MLYGLDGQIRHKLAFLNATLTKDCKITFIGHSIGCQIIMELMKELSDEDVNRDNTKSISQTIPTLTINKAYFLFPTIERMRQTPAGRVTWIQVTQYNNKVLIWGLNTFLMYIKDFLKQILTRSTA